MLCRYQNEYANTHVFSGTIVYHDGSARLRRDNLASDQST
jgi:hypothetical protein